MPVNISGSGIITGMNSGSSTDLNTVFAKLAGPTFAAGNLVWSSATLRADTATVGAQQTTTSTSYTDLATAGPAVTLTTGTKALVIISCKSYGDTNGSDWLMSFAVSGATTIAASDAWALDNVGQSPTDQLRASAIRLVTGLTAGSNTFTAKYRVYSGTGQFGLRDIIVMDMGS